MTNLYKITQHIHSTELELAREGNVRLVLYFDVGDPHEGVVFYKVIGTGADGKTSSPPIRSLADAVEAYNRAVAKAK